MVFDNNRWQKESQLHNGSYCYCNKLLQTQYVFR